jgi:four helix bundle protein
MAKTLEELFAYQLARQFKIEVYRLLREHPEARKDLKFWSQLRSSARSSESNTAEGWKRYGRREMAHFLNIALASNEEAKGLVQDGIDSGFFRQTECEKAFELGRRAGAAIHALMKSIERLPWPPPRRGSRPDRD